MGKLVWKRLLILCTFFTLGAAQNSHAILDIFCGGDDIVDAAVSGTTAIFYHTADVITRDLYTAETNSLEDHYGRLRNATWIDSEREVLSGLPQKIDHLTLLRQRPYLVVFRKDLHLTQDQYMLQVLSLL